MNRNILIVDDEEDVRAIAKLGLEMAAGWNVLTASSGQEALKVAATHKPDVILLDMMMPDMDGRATLQQLKANPATKKIPVILLTAKLQQSDRESFTDMDVAAIFAKPFRPLKLAEQINEVLVAL
ncbi:response regulator [Nostoc sp. UCD121]|jgi:CheY-like chemotaxis protein|uniref:response regulator n=1 Tax=unclassified Nostoc TaxID=2593658 RepID=UPI000DEC9F59|nr:MULTISPECIES: response regulator [unclassified Nostoc]MBC1297893.1 response regulator [Nostoc sp. UCD122]MBC1222209.1 response regulator [Nostoc sp. UCD120]MBC1279934.1 response regulator [Nostoc sp. UCD121]MBD2525531.1 response regulator [Nostoc sp. FACHB-133]QHG15913.1 response regulator [Nostoc sp. ATCC 53789]